MNSYNTTAWLNGQSPPLNAENLNNIENGISDLNDAVRFGIKNTVPDSRLSVHTEKIESYLENPAYDPDDNSYTYVPASISNSHYDRPNGVEVEIPDGGVRMVILDVTTGQEWGEAISGASHTIANLIPGHFYSYTIHDNSGEVLDAGTVKASGQVRMINGGGNTYNIRDLGGWACDGGKLRYGMIYRGSELNVHVATLTAAQIALFKHTLNIRDEIDLRSNSGAEGVTDTALGIGVGYTRVPLPYYVNIFGNTAEGNGPELTAQIMHRLIDNLRAGKPTYLHCEAGADRTGTICTMIEAVCGVSQSDIDRDYELTNYSYKPDGTRNLGRTRDYGTVGNANYKTMIIRFKEMEGESFRDKVVGFLLRCGVSIDEINTLRACLIDGEPEKLISPYPAASVTKNLTHVSINNTSRTVEMYQPFEAVLTAEDTYRISSIGLTMGGTDASGYITDHRISIDHVTGDIEINAAAAADYYTKAEIDEMLGDVETLLSRL